ncbi:hypothetical protein CCHR01_09290 [Colletotrichum chrysophilum]|uniref:Uncharacterized protein n=1 Tax=Colletotrichum chrysophilum TaxID=1836956 RepID=A0AAD9AJK1_9PEZI|nr:hypothetical protein CCHR01_09290 [Colletotrichum chrysophilum]
MIKYKDGGRLEGIHLANTSNGQDVVRLHHAAGLLNKDVAKTGHFTHFAFSEHKSFRFARVCRTKDLLQKPFGGGVSEFDVLRNAFWAAVPQAFRMRVAKYGPEAARGSQSSWRGWRGISRQQAGANDSKPAFRGLVLRRLDAFAQLFGRFGGHRQASGPKYDMASYPSHKPQTPQPPPPIPINDGDDDQGGATRDY